MIRLKILHSGLVKENIKLKQANEITSQVLEANLINTKRKRISLKYFKTNLRVKIKRNREYSKNDGYYGKELS